MREPHFLLQLLITSLPFSCAVSKGPGDVPQAQNLGKRVCERPARAPEKKVLASNLPIDWGPNDASTGFATMNNLVASEGYLYWYDYTNDDGLTSDGGRIKRIHRDGGEPTTIVSGLSYVND